MDKKFREALSEIYEILLYIDQKSFDEIPFEVIFKISENKSKEYDFKIDENEKELGEIIENKISEETKEILAYLYLKYWNKNEDENDNGNYTCYAFFSQDKFPEYLEKE